MAISRNYIGVGFRVNLKEEIREFVSKRTEAEIKRLNDRKCLVWPFDVGDTVYIHTQMFTVGRTSKGTYDAFIYDGKVSDNLYFHYIDKSGNKISTSFRLSDYELGILTVLNFNQYKELKKQELKENVEKYRNKSNVERMNKNEQSGN